MSMSGVWEKKEVYEKSNVFTVGTHGQKYTKNTDKEKQKVSCVLLIYICTYTHKL